MRVAIAEDSVLLREGVTRLLREEGFEVVAECGDADELLRKLSSHDLDVVILDIRLPPTHTDEGLRAALQIRDTHPEIGVLVLSQYVEVGLATQARSPIRPRVSATSSRTGSVRHPTSSRPSGGSPMEARPSIRSSSRRSSRSSAATTRSRPSPPASARCSS